MAKKQSLTQSDRDEVDKIVKMCEHLERSREHLSEEDRKKLPSGGTYHFEGFDGNDPNESRYNGVFQLRHFAPGMSMMPKYQRMLFKYTEAMKKKEFLTVEDMTSINTFER
jgi:uncharacterized protein YfbU (UPF0304 family)